MVIGPTAPMLTAAYHSASEAISGMNAVAGWRGAPRPVLARELLPERALMGDASAVAALHTDVMRPLADAGPTLTETLDAYLDCGGAIEACARKLFVHPNTVRYRLRRIADFTGRDPTLPRDAYVLRVAATVGHLAYQAQQSSAASNDRDARHAADGKGPGCAVGDRRSRLTDRGAISNTSHHVPFLWSFHKNIRQGS